MLSPLIFMLFSAFSSESLAQSCSAKSASCASLPLKESVLKDVLSFKATASQKMEEVLSQKEFKDFVNDLHKGQKEIVQQASAFDNSPHFTKEKAKDSGEDLSALSSAPFYVFVSFSVGEKALLKLAEEAKAYGATLVLRGFKEGSYVKTARALQKTIEKTGQGFLIDPELFTLFDITSVPTVILSKPFPLESTERVQTPLHDRLQGHVSLRYALDLFLEKGDLKKEAARLLKRRGSL